MSIYVYTECQCSKSQFHKIRSCYNNASIFRFNFPSDVNDQLSPPSFLSIDSKADSFYYCITSIDQMVHFVSVYPIRAHLSSLWHILTLHIWRPVNVLHASLQAPSSSLSNSTCVRELQKRANYTIYLHKQTFCFCTIICKLLIFFQWHEQFLYIIFVRVLLVRLWSLANLVHTLSCIWINFFNNIGSATAA